MADRGGKGRGLIKDNLSGRGGSGDLALMALVFGLSLFGMMMLYSASNYSAEREYGDAFLFVKKQLPGFSLGTLLMLFLWRYPYQKLAKYKYVFLAVSVVCLCLVFVPGIGIETLGSRRWIGFSAVSFQPSEIAKFSFILFSAHHMAENKEKMGTLKGILPVALAGGAICLLIILEPNMSITVCVGLLMLGMLFVGGCRMRHFAMILLPALALIPVLIIIEPYRLLRLSAFLDPWSSPRNEGYQLIQSLYGLGGGGLFGVGLFNSRQKFDFLPFSESDFIFSIIGEELGLFGCLLLICAFIFYIYRGIKIAVNADTLFGCYLASGIVMIVAIQVIINIAVVTGSIPPTGLPLPFISYGGSSLMMFMGASGVLLSISRKG
jgi:cell division protein FtsW